MNAEALSLVHAEAPARPREMWPAATLGSMLLLILLLSAHLLAVSADSASGAVADTYADGTGSVATLGVVRVAVGVE